VSIRTPNTTLASTGSTLESSKNRLGNASSLILTLPAFECSESDLQDIDFMIEQMSLGNIFPIHKIFDLGKQDKEPTYNESIQDYSYRGYRGKNIFQAKFDLRLDYHQLLQQFTNRSLRVIYCYNNKSFAVTQNGSNVRGFMLSNLTVEDLDLFATNLSPIRLEHAYKSELDLITIVDTDYQTSEIDRRIVTLETIATETEITLSVKFLGNTVSTLSASDVTVTDELHGAVSYSIFNYLGGVYKLSGFNLIGSPVVISSGCVGVLSEVYMGRQRYIVEAAISYTVYDTFESGIYETFESGNYELYNTTT